MARQRDLPNRPAKQRAGRSSSFLLVLIGSFKLFKALLLIAVGIGALKLLHGDISATLTHWTAVLRVDPDNRYVHRILERIFGMSPRHLKELSIGTFLYAGLFSIEGVGLLLQKRWAEYFTIITTSGLIPLELFELARHFTPAKLAVLIVNVAIVVYLLKRVRS
jgi:uncharacterized membrane protein (DUF2068 family)